MKRLLARLRRQLLPAPLLSATLGLSWLMLNQSASVGHLLLGTALALALPPWSRRHDPDAPAMRRAAVALRLAGTVLRDIVVSNIEVARRVLGPERVLRPTFVWVPLDIRSPYGMATFAGIITLTPGTVSSEITPDRRHLLVHVLHCPDDEAAAALVATMKARYEAPLREVFE